MLQQEIGLLYGGECKSDLEMSQCALPETKSACSDVVKPKVLETDAMMIVLHQPVQVQKASLFV